jgi:hypothetical protein
VKQKDNFAYCDGSTLTNVDGIYDDFNTANGSLVLPNGPFVYEELAVPFSATPTGWSELVNFCRFYTDASGNWRLNFNIGGTITSASSPSITLDGVIFKGVSGRDIAVTCDVSGGATITSEAVADSSTGIINIQTSAAVTSFRVSGDVPLESKPTFSGFDDDLKLYPVISLQTNVGNSLSLPPATATEAGTVSAESSGSISIPKANVTFTNCTASANVVVEYKVLGKVAILRIIPTLATSSGNWSISFADSELSAIGTFTDYQGIATCWLRGGNANSYPSRGRLRGGIFEFAFDDSHVGAGAMYATVTVLLA